MINDVEIIEFLRERGCVVQSGLIGDISLIEYTSRWFLPQNNNKKFFLKKLIKLTIDYH